MNVNNQNKNKNHLRKENSMKTIKNKCLIRNKQFLVMSAVGFFIIALSLVLQPILAEARGRFGPQRSPDEIVQVLTERLDLTDEQVEAIRPIIEEKYQKHNEMRTKREADRRVFRAEMQAIGDETHDQLSTVLTDEQIEELNALQEERRDRMGKRRNYRGPRGF